MALTYKLESFVKKISSPIVLEYNGEGQEFINGSEAYEHNYSKKYSIKAMYAKGNKIIVEVETTDTTAPFNYADEVAM